MAIESGQNTSGRALVEHWKYAADKGLMKTNLGGCITCGLYAGSFGA